MQGGENIEGECHCGRVRVRLRLSRKARDIELRACQCSFCRRHGARTFADPKGHAQIETDTPAALHRYRFALRTADYLMCRVCGVYLGAVIQVEGVQLATINAAGLDLGAFRAHEARPADYSGECYDERLRRRLAAWMPVEMAFAAAAKEDNAVH
jgi:hypothetical protein